MGFDLGGLLHQYVNGVDANTHLAQEHFRQASDNAPVNLVRLGLVAAVRSAATAPFAQMARQLFSESDARQRCGLLDQLVAGIGPCTLVSLLAGTTAGGLDTTLIVRLAEGSAPAALSAQQVARLSSAQVQAIAEHAEQHDPEVIDRLCTYLVDHPALVVTLGSAALSIALARMAELSRG